MLQNIEWRPDAGFWLYGMCQYFRTYLRSYQYQNWLMQAKKTLQQGPFLDQHNCIDSEIYTAQNRNVFVFNQLIHWNLNNGHISSKFILPGVPKYIHSFILALFNLKGSLQQQQIKYIYNCYQYFYSLPKHSSDFGFRNAFKPLCLSPAQNKLFDPNVDPHSSTTPFSRSWWESPHPVLCSVFCGCTDISRLAPSTGAHLGSIWEIKPAVFLL